MSMNPVNFNKNFLERNAKAEQVLAWYHSNKIGPDPLGPRPPGCTWWFDYGHRRWTETKTTDPWYIPG